LVAASVGLDRQAQRRAKLAALVASRPLPKPPIDFSTIENDALDVIDLSTSDERVKPQFTKLDAWLDKRQPKHKPVTYADEVKTVTIGWDILFPEITFF
jgi:hypothetical protein